MNYSEKLAALKRNPDVLLKEIGDEWRTPDKLYWGAFQLYGPFVLDLFSDGDNAKCATYYTAEDNALTQPWAEFLDGGTAFANPPYSRSSYDDNGQPTTGMRHIIAKAEAERDKGARIVFLIKAAPSESWWPEHADHVCWIKGRVGFELPLWAQHLKASSAGFGQAIVVFDKNWRGERERYIARDVLERQGQQLIDAIEQRAEQLAADMMRTQAPALPPELEPVPPELALELNEEQLALEPFSNEDEGSKLNAEPQTAKEEVELEVEADPQTRFNPHQLLEQFLSGKLKAEHFPTFIAALVIMFGEQDTYHIKQIQAALVAEAADPSVTIAGLTDYQKDLIGVAGRSMRSYSIVSPDLQVQAAAALVKGGALKEDSVKTILNGIGAKSSRSLPQAATNEA